MFKKDKRIRILSFAPRRTKRSNFFKLSLFAFAYLSLIGSLCALYMLTIPEGNAQLEKRTLGEKTENVKRANIGYLEISPSPTLVASVTPTQAPEPTPVPPTATPTTQAQIDNSTQYTAEKIGENTFRVTGVTLDNSMASTSDILDALNSYRQGRGVGTLAWDSNLATFAQDRANFFSSNSTLDNHTGFKSFMDNNGFEISGFNGLGENSAHLAGPMNGDRIIKEIFGADAPHDNNQLDSSWTHAGVGVNGNYININFGRNKR